MRLTLRTMLAFLDDVLEGPDAKELSQKIDESKFASDLVHRIRTSVRRLRLGAPKVDGKGMGADANSVAEYLDNTMPPEQFPEFEKVCLESDVHLAEVAACHQVLTIVLGEPATIDPGIRDRIYRLGHAQPTTAPPVSGNGNGAAAARHVEASPELKTEHKTHPVQHAARLEPSSERAQLASVARSIKKSDEPPFPLKSLALTILLGFIVAVVALRAIAPFDRNHPLWRHTIGSDTQQVSQAPTAPAAVVEPSRTDSPAKASDGTSTTETQPPASTEPAPLTQEPINATPIVENGGQEKERSATKSVVTTETSSTTVEPGTVAPAAPTVEHPIAPTTPEKSAVGTPTDPLPTNLTPTPVTAPKTGSELPVVPAKLPEVAPTPISVGKYISEEQILARLDPAKESWMVLPTDTPLNAEDQLLSLPTYRPQLLVAPSVKLTLAGEAYVRLHVPDATNVPRVTIDFGRALLVPVGEMGNTLEVDLAGRSGQLTFMDAESAFAVEVHPYLPAGADPLKASPNLVVQMWVLSGGVEWREVDREPLRMNAGQRGQFMDDAPIGVVPGEAMPDWVEGKNISDIDRRASQVLREFLTPDRPLALSLMEHTNYRQVEVRALSCRCLCYLDVFEPAIAALGDVQHKAYWHAELPALQTVLPFGAATAEKLRADIEKLHGADVEKIYRLLLGYSPEQLADGGAAELVEALESKSMTIRGLAINTLRRITDKSFQYYPDRLEQSKAAVTSWRKALEAGQIVYKIPPTPLPPLPPPEPDDSAKK